jgi:hypothetical protein
MVASFSASNQVGEMMKKTNRQPKKEDKYSGNPRTLKVLRTLKQNNNLLKFKKKRLLRASFSV